MVVVDVAEIAISVDGCVEVEVVAEVVEEVPLVAVCILFAARDLATNISNNG